MNLEILTNPEVKYLVKMQSEFANKTVEEAINSIMTDAMLEIDPLISEVTRQSKPFLMAIKSKNTDLAYELKEDLNDAFEVLLDASHLRIVALERLLTETKMNSVAMSKLHTHLSYLNQVKQYVLSTKETTRELVNSLFKLK